MLCAPDALAAMPGNAALVPGARAKITKIKYLALRLIALPDILTMTKRRVVSGQTSEPG
jgi:hypothetical protein